MPDGAIYVGRPTKWGNPCTIQEYGSPELAVIAFNTWLFTSRGGKKLLEQVNELRGKDLVCWCKPDEFCHADVLLELANRNA